MDNLQELSEWASLIVLGIQGLVLWIGWSLSRRFVGTESCTRNTTALEKRCQTLEGRVTLLESSLENLPTTAQLHALSNKITELAGDQKALAADVRGTRDIVARVEHMLNLLTESHIRE